MLIDAEKSLLLVVDIQDKLIPAVHETARFVADCGWMIELASALKVPVVFSEQYPQGLGHTAQRLLDLAPGAPVVGKVHFSCVAAGCIPPELLASHDHIIVIGIEAHVCVMQTALDLAASGKEVFVVADAVSSRHPDDIKLALDRMRAAGLNVVSREMVLFEWLRQAGTPTFKEISKRFLQSQLR